MRRLWQRLLDWCFKRDIRHAADPPVQGDSSEVSGVYDDWPHEPGVYAASGFGAPEVAYVVFVYGTPPFFRFRAVDAVDGKEQGYISYHLTFTKLIGPNAKKTAMVLENDRACQV